MSLETSPTNSLQALIESTPLVTPGDPPQWEQPVPLEAATAPQVAGNLLPSVLGAYARALAAATETPMELPMLAILAAAAACVAGRVVIQPEPGYTEPLNLWTLTALEPGNRKTAVLSQAFAPLRAWEADQATSMKPVIEQAILERDITEERIKSLRHRAQKADREDLPALISAIQAEQALMPEVPKARRLLVGDVTSEKVAILLADNDERLCLASDEAGVIATMAGRYNHMVSNLDVYLQAYSAAPVRVDRVNREPLMLVAPVLTIALAPQPAVIKAIPPEFLHRGFLDRFLLALPISPVGYRSLDAHPIPVSTKQDYQQLLYRLLLLEPGRREDGSCEPYIIVLSEEARAAWKVFSKRIERGMRPGEKLEFIRGWASKLPGNLARVAGIFHMVETPGDRPWEVPLSGQTMEAAIQLVCALIPHALMVYDAVGADPELDAARHVLAWVRRAGKASFTARDAFNALKGRFKRMEDIRPALKILQDRHYIRQLPSPGRMGPGRPLSPSFEVSPWAGSAQ